MRWSLFFGLQAVLVVALIGVVALHDDTVIVVKKPPQSIAKFYKPENKRQVWLHTMFKLRREMLAMETYALAKDPDNLKVWADKLDADYRKIAKMVPEWAPRLDLITLTRAWTAASEGRHDDVLGALTVLQDSCTSCHTDFRVVTAALYRAPDFSQMKIAGDTDFKKHMAALSRNVNHIKIAVDDGRDAEAVSAFSALKTGMTDLGATCVSCHNKLGKKAYPTPEISESLAKLEAALHTNDAKAKGQNLGMLAVLGCAQCHGTHRQAFDAKQLFGQDKDWKTLLRHRF